MTKLVNDGKSVLGQDSVFWNLYGSYSGFFKILELGNYTQEIDLLQILGKWAQNASFCSINNGNVSVDAAVFRTHQQYVRGLIGHREFGDVTFVTMFSNRPKSQKIGFANTFQIKVEFSAVEAYKKLFTSANLAQLNFYRTNLLEALDPIYDHLICDFLHYFLIEGSNKTHSIMEVPLSLTWLDDSSGAYWGILPALLNDRYISNRLGCTGIDTMIRKLFLTTGININRILPLCMPKLRDTLQRILDSGVRNSKKEEKLPADDNPEGKFKDKASEEFVPPEFQISSSVVIATEVSFLG